MSEQELFDKAAAHLLQQKQLATCTIGGKSRCTYKNTRSGNKCAVGGILTETEIKQLRKTDYDNVSAFYGGWSRLVDEEIVPNNHQQLLNALQIAHDSHLSRGQARNKGYVDFKPGLRDVAFSRKLEWRFEND